MMKNFLLFGCLMLILVCPLSFGSASLFKDEMENVSNFVIETDWGSTFGGISHDSAYSVIQTTDGGFALIGVTESFGVGNTDVWLVKTDMNGQHEWNRTFGGPSWDTANSVVQTADGGYALAGHSGSGSDFDYLLLKTNSTGQHEWNATFGGSNVELLDSMIQTSDGGFVLAGVSDSFNGAWMVKTDANGQHEWNKTFGGSVGSVIQTIDGGFALTGGLGVYPETDFLLLKLDDNGTAGWNTSFGGPEMDAASSVVQLVDGSFLLAGVTLSFGAGGYDFWLIKTDPSGQHEWNKTYGKVGTDELRSLIQTTDDGYLLAGTTYSSSTNFDIWVVKTDVNGEVLWDELFVGLAEDVVSSVLQLSAMSFVIAGWTESSGAGAFDMWLFKILVSEGTSTTTTTTTSPISTTTATTTTSATGSPGFDFMLVILCLSLALTFARQRRP